VVGSSDVITLELDVVVAAAVDSAGTDELWGVGGDSVVEIIAPLVATAITDLVTSASNISLANALCVIGSVIVAVVEVVIVMGTPLVVERGLSGVAAEVEAWTSAAHRHEQLHLFFLISLSILKSKRASLSRYNRVRI